MLSFFLKLQIITGVVLLLFPFHICTLKIDIGNLLEKDSDVWEKAFNLFKMQNYFENELTIDQSILLGKPIRINFNLSIRFLF